MIKYFRKIRFSVLETNNTGKYLKYPIGEIELVVIGINTSVVAFVTSFLMIN